MFMKLIEQNYCRVPESSGNYFFLDFHYPEQSSTIQSLTERRKNVFYKCKTFDFCHILLFAFSFGLGLS